MHTQIVQMDAKQFILQTQFQILCAQIKILMTRMFISIAQPEKARANAF